MRITHRQMRRNHQNVSSCSMERTQSLLKWVVNLLPPLFPSVCFSSGLWSRGPWEWRLGLGCFSWSASHHPASSPAPTLIIQPSLVAPPGGVGSALCLPARALSKPRACVSVACSRSRAEGRGPMWALVLKSPYNSRRRFQGHLLLPVSMRVTRSHRSRCSADLAVG